MKHGQLTLHVQLDVNQMIGRSCSQVSLLLYECVNCSPVEPRHANKNRRFALVDVVAYPEVAEDLNIDTSGTSKQLPTLALFANGR